MLERGDSFPRIDQNLVGPLEVGGVDLIAYRATSSKPSHLLDQLEWVGMGSNEFPIDKYSRATQPDHPPERPPGPKASSSRPHNPRLP